MVYRRRSHRRTIRIGRHPDASCVYVVNQYILYMVCRKLSMGKTMDTGNVFEAPAARTAPKNAGHPRVFKGLIPRGWPFRQNKRETIFDRKYARAIRSAAEAAPVPYADGAERLISPHNSRSLSEIRVIPALHRKTARQQQRILIFPSTAAARRSCRKQTAYRAGFTPHFFRYCPV